jgi:DNA primase
VGRRTTTDDVAAAFARLRVWERAGVRAPHKPLLVLYALVRTVLDRAGAECLCKTSGKRGLHVVVPLGAQYDRDQARQFAELVARLVNRVPPASTSLERCPARRRRKVYPD